MSLAKTQTSESFRLSALLSFSGGLQDAYTYNVRDGVFANAQTGNVVLSVRFGIGTIWISPAILLAVALMMIKE